MCVLNNDLAIHNRGTAIKLGCRLRYAEVALSPIKAVAGISACFAALEDQLGTVTIVLDLVDPACTGRRIIDCGCEFAG